MTTTASTNTSPSSRRTSPREYWLARWPVVSLLLICVMALGRICFGQFTTWDDGPVLRTNIALLPPTLASIGQYWKAPSGGLYIPVSYTAWGLISWATQITTGSGQIVQVPWAFHAASLAVHLCSTMLVFRILSMLKLSQFACFCGALLFATHPIQVEAVAWASGLKDVLSGCLALLALQQYVAYATDSDRSGTKKWLYFRASVWFIAAALAKPSVMTLPLCAAAIDRWGVGRRWRRVLPPAAGWLIIAVPIAVVARLAQDTTYSPHIAIWQRPLIAADSLAFYLAKLVWPLHLNVDYGRTPTAVLASGQCYWDWIIPAGIGVALVLGRRRRPLLLLAGIAFLVGVLPVLGLNQFLFQYYSTTADHYLYLSMFGPALAVAWLLTQFPHRILNRIALVSLLACSLLTFHRAGYWKDDRTLWQQAIFENPQSFAAYTNLGIAYADEGDSANAVDCFAHAVALRPQEDIARNDLANALHEAGRLNEAINAKQRTLDIEQANGAMGENWARHTAEMGAFLCEAGRYREAIPYLETAHTIAPKDPKVNFLLRRATTQSVSKN